MADLNSTIVRGNLRVTDDINISGTINGNGSGLTNLNASNIGSGSLALARITAGTNGQVLKMVSGAPAWSSDTNTTLSGVAYCNTAAATGAKEATLPGFALSTGQYILLRVVNTNSATSGVTLKVNNTDAKSIYVNGSAWSTSNQLVAGDYLATYDGTYWKLTRIYLTDNNTATAVDNILDGSNSGTQITYAPYDATTADATWVGNNSNAGKFYLGTADPIKTTRLNYNGFFYANNFYSQNPNFGKTEIGWGIINLFAGSSSGKPAIDFYPNKNDNTNSIEITANSATGFRMLTLPDKSGTIATTNSLAPDYSASSTYAAGARVTYNGGFYECNTAISTPEAWNSSHWTALSMAANFVTSDVTVTGALSTNYITLFKTGVSQENPGLRVTKKGLAYSEGTTAATITAEGKTKLDLWAGTGGGVAIDIPTSTSLAFIPAIGMIGASATKNLGSAANSWTNLYTNTVKLVTGTTQKATMEYDDTAECIKFIFA